MFSSPAIHSLTQENSAVNTVKRPQVITAPKNAFTDRPINSKLPEREVQKAELLVKEESSKEEDLHNYDICSFKDANESFTFFPNPIENGPAFVFDMLSNYCDYKNLKTPPYIYEEIPIDMEVLPEYGYNDEWNESVEVNELNIDDMFLPSIDFD